MERKTVNVGLIGHKFMGRSHSHAYRDVAMFFDLPVVPVMNVLCGTEADELPAFAQRFGWDRWVASWEEVTDDPEIDLIDISSPDDTHWEIAMRAAAKGKHIFCEKPMALTFAEAQQMYEAAEAHHVCHMVNFNYRSAPAVRLAKKLIEEGRLGRLFHFNAIYLQDWCVDERFPFVWRMDRAKAGGGAVSDKGAHVIDLARYLVGEFQEVASAAEIFIKERPVAKDSPVKRAVTSYDGGVFMARFQSGALGVFEVSNMGPGHRNGLTFEVNGSKGSLRFDLERLNELQVFYSDEDEESQGFRTIMVTQPSHPYISHWWPPGHSLGWEHLFIHQLYEMLQAIAGGYTPSPSFYDGMKAQEVIDTVLRAVTERKWLKIGGSL